MSTALEDWGNQKRADGTDVPEHGIAVNEHDITGGGEGVDHHFPDDDRGMGDDAGDIDAAAAAADDEALAKKKKQGTQIIMAAGGLCVALVVGVVGVGIMKSNSAQQVEVAQQVPEQQPVGQPSDLQLASVPGPASSSAPAIVMERQDGSPAIGAGGGQSLSSPPPPEFGLQNGVGAPAATPSGPAALPAAPVIQAQVQAQPAAPGQKPQQIAAPTAVPKVEVAPGELDKLRADVAALRADLVEKTNTVETLRGEVSGLRAQLAAKNAAPKPVQPKPAIAKAEPKPAQEASKAAATPAVVVVTETVQPNNNPPAALAAASTKGKVRSDFRIYAAVDGRFWVVGPDNEPVQVGVRSPLSDGSRVTSIDVDKNVIFTTAGEIR